MPPLLRPLRSMVSLLHPLSQPWVSHMILQTQERSLEADRTSVLKDKEVYNRRSNLKLERGNLY